MEEITSVSARTVSNDDNSKQVLPLSPMQEINEVLKGCKFGIFHMRLLLSALIGVVARVLVANTTPYLLPNAECDLKMNLMQKGVLIAIPHSGVLMSSLLAGFLTDTFGRKKLLLSGYAGIFTFTVLSASSQTYEMLVVFKFFEGVFFAISSSPTVTLTAEFCHNGIRDRVMMLQSAFGSVAQILIAVLSWATLTQNWSLSLGDGYFNLKTWNFYLYICSLWSLTAFTLYCFIPESPTFLLTQKKYDEARFILIQIYTENTMKPADTFPFPSLWINEAQKAKEEASKSSAKSGLKHKIVLGLDRVKLIFLRPLLFYLILICSMAFLSLSMYNVIRMWFPQLSTIMEHSNMGGGNVTQDLCTMLDAYTENLKKKTTHLGNGTDVDGECVPVLSGDETYINSIILSSVCLIPYFINGILVNKVGKKKLLFASGLIALGATLGLRWSNSKTMVVTLYSINTAVTQSINSLLQSIVVEFFPATVKTLAISIIMMIGRTGILVGNVMFPVLLSMGCVVPFYLMAGIVCCITVMTIFLPSKK